MVMIDLLLAASEACNNVQEQTPIREVSTVAPTETPIRTSPSKDCDIYVFI